MLAVFWGKIHMINIGKYKLDNKSKSENYYNLFKKYIISSCLLVAILVLVSSASFYNILIRKLKNEVDNLTSNNIVMLRNFMEKMFHEMDRIAYEIGSEIDFMPYNILRDGYGSMKCVNRLRSYCSANTYISDLIILYDKNIAETYGFEPKIFSIKGAYNPDTFWNYIYPFEPVYSNKIKQKSRNIIKPEIWNSVSIVNKKRNEKYLIYITPLGIVTGDTNNRGIILFLVSHESINSMIHSSLKEYGGTFRLFDNNGKIIYEVSYDNNMNINDFEFFKNYKNVPYDMPLFDSVKYDQMTYKRIQLYSSIRGWTYVMDFPLDKYVNNIYRQIYPFAFLVIMVMVLGIIGSYLMSKRNYRPIGKLMNVIVQYYWNKKDNIDINDVIIAIKEIVQKNNNMQAIIHKQQDLCRLQFIQNLIHGRFSSMEDLKSQMEQCNIKFESPYFAVLVVLTKNDDKNKSTVHPSYLEEIKQSVISELEQICINKGATAFGVSLGPDRGISIVLCFKNEENMDMFFKKDEKNMIEYFKANFGIELTIGIGRLYKNPLDIYFSYREALDAVSFQFIHGTNRIYTFEQVQHAYYKCRFSF